MARGDYRPDTPDGTSLRVATSALIKALRRGQELEAYYWSRQIEQAGTWRYVWRRLQIFATEDVGLGNPQAISVVTACWTAYERNRRESSGPPDRSFLAFAVIFLTRSGKNREADDLLNAAEVLAGFGWAAQVPPEARDLHTPEGREAIPAHLRGRHWMQVASHVEPYVGTRDWRLFMWRRYAQRGLVPVEWVRRLAAKWHARGLLRFGPDGYPEARFDWTAIDPEFPEHYPPKEPCEQDWSSP